MTFGSSEAPVRKSLFPAVSCLFVASIVFPLAGCIAHAPSSGGGGGGGGNQQTTVTVSPTTATVSGGSATTFTATVTGPQETAVTWYVNGVQNGSSTLGTLAPGTNTSGTTTAVYTAPATLPTPPTVSITAVSVANGTTSSASTVTLTASQVAVTVAPATANLSAGVQQQFTATVTGTTNTTVGWYVDNVLGGNSTVGTISTTGLYTAPSNVTTTATATVMAQSQADTTKQATATVTIAGIAVSVSPVPASTIVPLPVPVGGTQEFSATVTGTSNTGIASWQVNNVTGGTPTFGTIVSSGSNTAAYTAPASVNTAPFTVTITAVSSANAASSGSILANVHVTVNVTPATDTIGQSGNLLYTAVVNGAPSGSLGVNWSVTSANGGGFVPTADTTGIPSNQGIYIAPPLSQGVSTETATILATSQFDQTQSGTATTTVQLTDPLGTVSNFQPYAGTCPTAAEDNGNTACYSMTVSCDGIAPWTTYLKVNTPSLNPPTGTVIFSGDDGGANLYDTEYTNGSDVVGSVVTGGYTAVQVSFGAPFDNGANPYGWLTGPGGVRRLACRYATVADWIYHNPQMVNSNASSSAPMCATGNGAGAGAIAYAVSEYGMNGLNAASGVTSNFAMVELTSGPIFTAIDQGCICSTAATGPSGAPCNPAPTPMCYTVGMTTIDAAYSQPTVCSSGNTINTLLLTSDSIYYQRGKGAVFPLPNTTVNMLFGKLDSDAGEPQGWQWNRVLLQNTPTQSCQQNASHDMPNDPLSATQIGTDINAHCK
jgi:hypothetical protein